MKNGTVLLYSSHDRCQYLHERFITGRALEGKANKRIVLFTFSDGERGPQEYSWGKFRVFFDKYAHLGLEYSPFYWHPDFSREEVDQLWKLLATSEVVILGGGHPYLGMERYKGVGAKFDGEWGKFGRILHERQEKGLFTAGFSAGSDQLGERLYRSVHKDEGYNEAFGLARNVMTRLHHDRSQNGDLARAAQRFPHERVFGLPNDSGLYVAQGALHSGNLWQVIEFVIDTSWDVPEDQWHIKTRAGEKIEHIYPDGRHWAFNGGDHLVRIRAPDFSWDDSWIFTGSECIHYGTHSRDGYRSIEHLLNAH